MHAIHAHAASLNVQQFVQQFGKCVCIDIYDGSRGGVFSKALHRYIKHRIDLEQTVVRVVLHSAEEVGHL